MTEGTENNPKGTRKEGKKMKKMTMKEFKEALTIGGLDFEIWGWEGILNELVLAQQHIADNEEKLGCKNISEQRRNSAEKLIAFLDARGYYEA